MTINPRLRSWFSPVASEADFTALYQVEMPRIYNYFRFRVGAGPIAEDLTSETFEKAWRHRNKYKRNLSAFSTWLFTIAARVAVDYYRKPRRETSLEAENQLALPLSLEDQVDQRADYARLAAILGQLDQREREVIALRYGSECTNRQIAALLGLSESNVGVILHRTLHKVRARWEEQQ
jgi:RNA polymerase sigma-70 factor (ECF subfamily)